MARSRTILGALALTLALVAAGCGSSGGSSGDSATTAPGGSSKAPVALSGKVNGGTKKDISSSGATAKVEIEMDDNYYSPTYVKAAPGATVTVELKNEGSNPHTFTLDGGKVDQQVDPGSTKSVTVTVPTSGSLRFSCNFHGAMGMQGAFYTGTGSGSSTKPAAPTTTTGRSGY